MKSRRFLFWMLAFGLVASVSARAQAQTYATEADPYGTYGGGAPADPRGVLPEGMSWNQPLKAGDLKLTRQQPAVRPSLAPTPRLSARRTLPIGDIQSPQLAGDEAVDITRPPVKSSSASLMLMQGMQAALQKAGQNPNIPKSSDVQAPASGDFRTPVKLGGGNAATPAPSAPIPAPTATAKPLPRSPIFVDDEELSPILPEPTPTVSPSPTPAASGIGELLGRLMPFSGAKPTPTPTPATLPSPVAASAVKPTSGKAELPLQPMPEPVLTGQKNGGDTVSRLSAMPPMSAGASAKPVEALPHIDEKDLPKATEMTEAPVSLEQMRGTDLRALSSKETVGDTKKKSLFGAPVKEEPTARRSGGEAGRPASPGKCLPKIENWTKACNEAGYPDSYVGEIKGETRTECPSGNVRDVWLDNTCAPSGNGDEPGVTSSAAASRAAHSVPGSNKGAVANGKNEGAASTAFSSSPSAEGRCGGANGLAVDVKPASDLCEGGVASAVTGEGPWRWTCKGNAGGMTVSCAAPFEPKADAAKDKKSVAAGDKASLQEDGRCGTADGVGTDDAPTANLCTKGIASRVNGVGPWTWACSGTNGGIAVACNAPEKMDGICGSAAAAGADEAPTNDLCIEGIASAVTGAGPWHWTCSGIHGGSPATCSAAPRQNAVCGEASLMGHKATPKDDLCKVGKATQVEGSGPWTWICTGGNGGASVNCRASVMEDGGCGPAHGGMFEAAPSAGLCMTGQASRVTGSGPWNWSCRGVQGGSTASCAASLGTKAQVLAASGLACGAAADTFAVQAPKDQLCSNGKPGEVVAKGKAGPWAWSCTSDTGMMVDCSTPGPKPGQCGKADGEPKTTAPTGQLCVVGFASSVQMSSDKSQWTWTCSGSMGAPDASCKAPVGKAGKLAASKTVEAEPEKKIESKPETQVDDEARCGASAGRGALQAPDTDLCDSGKASEVRGHGPWTWLCSTRLGSRVLCDAPRKQDGACGSANGAIQRSAPVNGLCATGTATPLEGSGPWLWSCVGSGGGDSASCSAMSEALAKVDGLCGAAANGTMTTAPEANLCDSGTSSRVHGQGPWTWTCSGTNGGVASICSTAKVLPKAPEPPGATVNGNCGPSNGMAMSTEPREGLCTSGVTSGVSGNGPWNWSCLGVNGGMTVSCTAPLLPPAPVVGMCGSASGTPTMTKPRNGLCDAGIASSVSGKGPWTWSCSGTNGGAAVGCVAPLTGGSSAPTPSLVSSDMRDIAPAPKAAPVGLVTPKLSMSSLSPKIVKDIPARKPVKEVSNPGEETAGADKVAGSDGVRIDAPYPREKSVINSTAGLAKVAPVPGARLVLDPELSTLSFARTSDALDKNAVGILEKLAVGLKDHESARITVVAYASAGDTISTREARRLSLNRALAVRDFLNSKGVSNDRIDIRALGANVPSGEMDRVDIRIN